MIWRVKAWPNTARRSKYHRGKFTWLTVEAEDREDAKWLISHGEYALKWRADFRTLRLA